MKIIDDDDNVNIAAELAQGNGVAFHWLADRRRLKGYVKEQWPDAVAWYTERNGDPLALVTPSGVSLQEIGNQGVCGYGFAHWSDPEAPFWEDAH